MSGGRDAKKHLRGCASAALIATVPMGLFAQEAEPGGVSYSLTVDQRLEASDTSIDGVEDSNIVALTALGFGIVTETRTQRAAFDISNDLQFGEDGLDVTETRLGVEYNRTSADASLAFSIDSTRSDLAFLGEVADFVTEDGDIVIPADFDEISGTGERYATTASATLTFGDASPVGYRLSAAHTILRYVDASSAALEDEDTTTLGAGLRLNFTPVTIGEVDLTYSIGDSAVSAPSDSVSLSGALTFERPNGALIFGAGVTRDADDETFWSADATRLLVLPQGELTVSIGAVEDSEEEARLIGTLAYDHELPAGGADFSLEQTLGAGGDRATTTVQVGFVQDITEISSLRFGFDYAQTADPDGSDRLGIGGVTIAYGRSLNAFWDATVGVRFSGRDDVGTISRSNTIFAGLSRTYSWR